MKKIIVVIALCVSALGIAQKDGQKKHNKKDQLSSEQMATLQTKKLTLALDLTEAQQKNMYAVHLENAKLRKTKMEERKANREKDDTKKPTTEERYKMEVERLDYQIAQKAKVKSILSAEQYAQWQKMQHRKGPKGKKGKGDKKGKGAKKGKKERKENDHKDRK